MKMNIFRGDLSDTLSKTATLVLTDAEHVRCNNSTGDFVLKIKQIVFGIIWYE